MGFDFSGGGDELPMKELNRSSALGSFFLGAGFFTSLAANFLAKPPPKSDPESDTSNSSLSAWCPFVPLVAAFWFESEGGSDSDF
jgi:hypothetical protein